MTRPEPRTSARPLPQAPAREGRSRGTPPRQRKDRQMTRLIPLGALGLISGGTNVHDIGTGPNCGPDGSAYHSGANGSEVRCASQVQSPTGR